MFKQILLEWNSVQPATLRIKPVPPVGTQHSGAAAHPLKRRAATAGQGMSLRPARPKNPHKFGLKDGRVGGNPRQRMSGNKRHSSHPSQVVH